MSCPHMGKNSHLSFREFALDRFDILSIALALFYRVVVSLFVFRIISRAFLVLLVKSFFKNVFRMLLLERLSKN